MGAEVVDCNTSIVQQGDSQRRQIHPARESVVDLHGPLRPLTDGLLKTRYVLRLPVLVQAARHIHQPDKQPSVCSPAAMPRNRQLVEKSDGPDPWYSREHEGVLTHPGKVQKVSLENRLIYPERLISGWCRGVRS